MVSAYFLLHIFMFSNAYENIALNKPAWQLNSYRKGDDRFDASNAVDGLKAILSWNGGQCVVSANDKRNATWRVDLEDILSIHHITIYYRTDNQSFENGYSKRFLGFSLYVSNTTNMAQGELCFHDTNYTRATIPAVLNVTCPVHGRHVIYYNERLSGVTYPPGYDPHAFNELCEVEVYGCPDPGFYGVNCSIPCPNVNCKYCHIETGACQGCKPGYKGLLCEQECDTRKYGEGCQNEFGKCKNGTQCHHITGTCRNGCEPGLKEGQCVEQCDTRKYGEGCQSECGKCKNGTQCHHITGACQNGCEPGLKEGQCVEQCDNRKYGDGCQSECGKCKNWTQCHHINGACQNGCEPGFKEGQCVEQCDNRKYGEGCQSECGKCKNGTQCHHINGTCLNGCEPGFKEGQCVEKCDNRKYGEGCQSECGKCKNGTQCHHINGTCLNGCEPGFKEGQCVEKNIALDKPTWQLHEYKKGDHRVDASNAVDGLKSNLSWEGGQCVVSDNNQHTAIWRVDLGDILSIRHIIIYYRTGNIFWGPKNGFTGRFLGFSLHVSNTTNRREGIECFHDTNYTNATIPAVLSITCPVHGQYVIYYNERLPRKSYPGGYSSYAFNELCELEVYGCPTSGYYGTDCSLPCPDINCRYCHIETGACQGCNPGYKGHQCELECEDGNYGEGCQGNCGNCADPRECHHVNGTCLNGCMPGYKPGTCKDPCDGKTYGAGCQQRCGSCLNLEECHHVNGSCLYGCNPGYQGMTCNDTCDNGVYGEQCNTPCGRCRNSESCHHINGTCLTGCDRGFHGWNCTEECEDGYFGENCLEPCNHTCRNCNKSSGICDSGCIPGWKGTYCEEECDGGVFGENCSSHCGFCNSTKQCHHINGTCFGGSCDLGYKGIYCNEVCESDQYGYNCDKNCSSACVNGTCDRQDGSCEMIITNLNQQSGGDNTASIAGPIVGTLAVLIGIIVVLIIVRRSRKARGQRNQEMAESSAFNNLYMNANPRLRPDSEKPPANSSYKEQNKAKESHRLAAATNDGDNEMDGGSDDLYVNEAVTDILIDCLELAIAEKREGDNNGFRKEYAALPHGELHKCDAGKLPENAVKNRYKTTFPCKIKKIKNDSLA